MNPAIYCLSGWGFSGEILQHSVLKNRNSVDLNYFTETVSIQEMAFNLSRSILESSTLIAWSFGGLIAIQIASLFPKKVRKLVLLSSQPKLVEEKNHTGIQSSSMQSFIDLSLESFETLQTQFIRAVAFPNKRILPTLEYYSLKPGQNNLIHWLNQMNYADLKKEYAHLNLKILHILAEKDSIIKQEQSALLTLNPKAYIVSIKDAGHAGFLTHTERYATLLDHFLRDTT